MSYLTSYNRIYVIHRIIQQDLNGHILTLAKSKILTGLTEGCCVDAYYLLAANVVCIACC